MDFPRRSLWAVTSVPGESLSSGQTWMLVGRDVEQSASEATVAGSSCLRLALALALASRTWARLPLGLEPGERQAGVAESRQRQHPSACNQILGQPGKNVLRSTMCMHLLISCLVPRKMI